MVIFSTFENEDSDVLTFWKFHGGVYSVLQSIARDFLAVQATSAFSEREFSKAKKIFVPERSLGITLRLYVVPKTQRLSSVLTKQLFFVIMYWFLL